jgi:uncharacterized protein (TIGR02271 family)
MNDSQNQNANRDPITGEPRSHPVGTGAGAAAGGATGAAVGMAGGPIGAGVGAAVGAVAGGLAGKGTAEHFNPTQTGELGRFIDYTVVDRDNEKVGTVDAVWEDHTGEPSYLAIRTGWLGLGKAHVVPAQAAQVNEAKRHIKLPYTAEQVKNAPAFDSQDDITSESEYTISSHFGLNTEPPRRSDDGVAPLARPRDEARVQLKEEELKVGKREVEYGGVRLRKIVRTETVNQPVELKREEIVVERVPVESGAVAGDVSDFGDEEIYVPLRREEAVVEKTTRVREEVRLGKRTETENETVSDTIRREDVEIDRNADAKSGKSSGRSL